MNGKKIVIVAVVALVLFFVIAQPTNAAHLVGNIIDWLRSSAEAIVTFLSKLFS